MPHDRRPLLLRKRHRFLETAKKEDNTLVILNYGKYIEESVLDQFTKETGIKVKLEEYESPEEMYTKFSAGSINYDLVCTSITWWSV